MCKKKFNTLNNALFVWEQYISSILSGVAREKVATPIFKVIRITAT